jgi:neutral trehalase
MPYQPLRQFSRWSLKLLPLRRPKKVADGLKANFLKPGGLVTTLNFSGQQWDAPNGWAPLQYMAIDGLENYNHRELAKDIATRWMTSTSAYSNKPANCWRNTTWLIPA